LIVDSSALVAIVMREAGTDELVARLAAAPQAGISAPILLETSIVLAHRLRSDPRLLLGQLLREARISVIPFGEDHAAAAVATFLRFGKGRHPAGLNFGDCISYATAALAELPLLFVGEDFAQTDIARA
jgi:ribonuclease VapC